MQLASVCSSWRDATRIVVKQFDGFSYNMGDPVPSRMDSKLILDLIPGMVEKVMLYSPQLLGVPGMAQFVASCPSLQEMHIAAGDLLACSQADACLAGCRGLETLTCKGWYLPHVLNSSIRELDVDLEAWADLALMGDGPEKRPEALLFRIASLPALERLTLNLGAFSHVPAMPGLTWRCIKTLTVNLDLEDHTSVDLGWLQDQRADWLHLSVTMRTDEHHPYAQLLQELSSITVHCLSFVVQTHVDRQTQLLWSTLTPLNEFCIYMDVQTMSLYCLPRCQLASIWLAWCNAVDGEYDLFWPAVSAHPGKVRVHSLHSIKRADIIGFPKSLPDHAEPWQLELYTPVRGIQAAFLQECGPKSVMQNSAADAAGWEVKY